MKKIIIRNGLYGVALITIISLATYFLYRNKPNYEVQEAIGYATIVVSLLFVYFGIRQWRDTVNSGRLTFGRGLWIGTLISLFPSVAFGLFSWIEMSYLDPEFSDRYYKHYIEKVKRSTPPGELDAALKKIAQDQKMFSNPFAQFFLMFLTVFIIGFIILIISALILRRNKP